MPKGTCSTDEGMGRGKLPPGNPKQTKTNLNHPGGRNGETNEPPETSPFRVGRSHKVKGFHPVCEVLRRLHGLPDTNLQQSKTSEGKTEKEYSCRNITLKQDFSFRVTVIRLHYTEYSETFVLQCYLNPVIE